MSSSNVFNELKKGVVNMSFDNTVKKNEEDLPVNDNSSVPTNTNLKVVEAVNLETLEKRVKAEIESLASTQDTTALMDDLREISKSKVGGMTHMGRAIGTHRQGLYRLFDAGNPKVIKLSQVLDAMGYQLTLKKKK